MKSWAQSLRPRQKVFKHLRHPAWQYLVCIVYSIHSATLAPACAASQALYWWRLWTSSRASLCSFALCSEACQVSSPQSQLTRMTSSTGRPDPATSPAASFRASLTLTLHVQLGGFDARCASFLHCHHQQQCCTSVVQGTSCLCSRCTCLVVPQSCCARSCSGVLQGHRESAVLSTHQRQTLT